jgi:hypothetical protein
VKNSLGHTEKQPSLNSRWLLTFNWLDYFPEDNLRDHRLQYLNQDLVTLLRLKHHLFWSNVVLDSGFARFLDTFLLYARRLGTTRFVNSPAVESVGAEPSSDPGLLSPSHKTMMRNIFAVIIRMASAKESTNCGFGSPQVHGDLVFDVLDFPRLFDFVSLYARYNFPLVSNTVRHLFSIQPKYEAGLIQSVTAANQVLLEMARQLSNLLKLALSPSAQVSEASISAATGPIDNSAQSAEAISSMRHTSEDLATYFIDLVYSFSTFSKAYPETCAHLAKNDSTALLSYSLRATLPNLKLVFNDSHPGAIDSLRRHVASRNHTLSIINKTITYLVQELFNLLVEKEDSDFEIPTKPLPVAMFDARTSKIEEAIQSITSQLQTLTMPDRQLVERVSKSSDDIRPLAWLLLEEELQQSYASIRASEENLKSSTGLSQTVTNPEASMIVRDLDIKYSILALLDKAHSSIHIASGSEVSQLKTSLSGLETVLTELRALFDLAPSESVSAGSALANKQLELQWQESSRRSHAVSEIFPDLSSGFIIYALMKHYSNETERMISDLLEHNIPPALNSIDRKLSSEDARKLVFGDLALSEAQRAAEAEERERFKLTPNAQSSASSKRKGGANERVAFKDALNKGDANELARATAKFVERQERDEQERSYITQLRRARGEKVDEVEEELFEQLRASAELSQRAERGALTYEDEPDDSLDDFHPSGVLDDDNDSKLSTRRGPIRSSRTAQPLPSASYSLKSQRTHDDIDDEEEVQRNFAADDALLLPYTPPSQHSAQTHQHHGKNQHGGHGGQNKPQHGNQSKGQQQQPKRQQSQSSHPQQAQSSNPLTSQQNRQGGRGKKSGQSSDASAPNLSSNAPAYTPSSSNAQHNSASSGVGRGKRNEGHQQGGGRGKGQPSNRGK